MLTCYRSRRRIGAYLDGALDEPVSQATAGHLRSCARCQQKAAGLRKLRVVLQEVAAPLPDPDWTGFWQGIVRGIEDERLAVPAPAPQRRWWLSTPRLAVGGLVTAAVLLVSLTLVQTGWNPLAPEVAVTTVSSANSEYPGGTMVYASPDRQVTVVWVFDD